jgi:hypothetical protein
MKRSLMIARFPYGNLEHSDCVDWLCQSYLWAQNEDTVSSVGLWRLGDTPVSMTRNVALEVARQNHYDYVLMVDSDMSPDLKLPGAVPFLPAAWEFALKHDGPCLVGAPYCAGPPNEKVVVYRWAAGESGAPTNPSLEEYPREEAAGKAGFERVAALATGLLLIDMRALEKIEPPYFDYEWSDRRMVKKASTEDIHFTRDLSMAGVPLYSAWDSWAGHWKQKCVGKPEAVPLDQVPARLARLIRRPPVPEVPQDVTEALLVEPDAA